MTIRKATKDDVQAIFELYVYLDNVEDALVSDISEDLMILREHQQNVQEDVLQSLQEAIDDTNQLLLVYQESTVLAFLHASIKENDDHPEWFESVRIGFLEGLVVHKDHQGKGISSALHKVFLQWAKEKGAKVIGLHVYANNSAKNIYAKWGYHDQSHFMYKKL